ncbi:hypothetical protein NEOLI_004871 [Neolecta irregularis DAH-3]|uniref:Mediator of RNA polymerase II transcription subunit 1 n=1 Tax=Neolecta irregularis (strain DAH-3) TaxID=1198029 RepID=A0A1U7LUH0_NEOID|nr:hypothetical protein NEOLI_004871 [Neolecta irregularis DAH-3]|eukprot:OLL26161.1 hypothetical protein NEOLI_004871 [Neolecta irregularis DAH-3]
MTTTTTTTTTPPATTTTTPAPTTTTAPTPTPTTTPSTLSTPTAIAAAARARGLQCFVDASPALTTLSVAGTLVVIDIDFAADCTVQRVQVAYADPAGEPSLDPRAAALLKHSLARAPSIGPFLRNLAPLCRLDAASLPAFDCFAAIKLVADHLCLRSDIGKVHYNDARFGLHVEYAHNHSAEISYEPCRPPADSFDVDIPPLLTPSPNDDRPLLVALLSQSIWIPLSLARKLCLLMDLPSSDLIFPGPDNSLETVLVRSLVLASNF